MQKIQKAPNDLAWQTIQAKDIKPGNLITALTAKTPRLISNVIIDNNVVTLYEKTGMHEHVYLKVTAEHKFDLLIHSTTRESVNAGEIYE